MVVGGSDIRTGKSVHPADIIDASIGGANCRRYGGQEEIADSVEAAVLFGNVSVLTIEAEVSTTLRGLGYVALQVVDLDSGFEGVVAIDFGYAVYALDAPDVLQGRRE